MSHGEPRNKEKPMRSIKAGFETTDPITQTRIVVVKDAEDMSGRGWVTEVYCPQGSTPFLPHLHQTWTETFEILEGSATCLLGSDEHRMTRGESIVMPPGVPHVHPWNTGSEQMVFRHINDFGAKNVRDLHDLGASLRIHGHFDQHQLAVHIFALAKILDLHDIGELVQLLYDLLERCIVTAGDNGHAGGSRISRRGHIERVNVVAPPTEKAGDPGEHPEFVFYQD
jgi:mannose-6-phosphate isomerase-like protein (cupin superfamily)